MRKSCFGPPQPDGDTEKRRRIHYLPLLDEADVGFGVGKIKEQLADIGNHLVAQGGHDHLDKLTYENFR